MSIHFNAEEILRMAEKIEENGGKFYRRAAEKFQEPAINQLLTRLASEEDKHLKIFQSMREKAKQPASVVFEESLDRMLHEYLNAFADSALFNEERDPLAKVTGDEDIEHVLDGAIRREMESVMFYLGMKDAVKDDSERKNIDRIIREEMNHYHSLKAELARLRGKLN